jgi:NADH-quinone oxidoreductase subunit C
VTTVFSVKDIISSLNNSLAGVTVFDENTLLVDKGSLKDLLSFLKSTPGMEFDYLVDMAAVDYWDYFELVYQIVSIKNNHRINLKSRQSGRENIIFPSISGIYQGAEFHEREIHDLFGLKFVGHPNLKPIVLWEGFEGHPLRKDYL